MTTTQKVPSALTDDALGALERDLLDPTRAWNQSTTGALAVSSEYLEVVATVR